MSFAEYRRLINEALDLATRQNSPFFPSLYEGGRYVLLSGGKRIRPILTLCTVEMLLPGNSEALKWALQPACAIECVHTYSMIHDDLPCMDNDDFRRGLPTLHRVYTEGHAVLVGDFLLTHAFEMLATAPFLDEGQKIALILKLAKASGAEGMIGGQVMDIEQSSAVAELHCRKTAALFSAAVEFGAIIAKAASDIYELLNLFSTQFGKLFQLVDDILDDDHPLGTAKALESAHMQFESALQTLNKIPFDSSSLKKLCESLLSSANSK